MEYSYKLLDIGLKKLINVFLFWMVLSGISFATECPLQEFKQYVEKLDKTKVESVDSLKENYNKTASEQSKQCRSILFGDFRHYYDEITQVYIASVEEKLNEKYPLSAKKEKKYKNEFKKIGLRLDQSEGMYYVEADSAWFLKEFSKGLPEEWISYLKQSDYEAKNRLAEDGAPLISWEEMRKRIIFWENFLYKYPDYPGKNIVEKSLSRYLAFYLGRLGNYWLILAYDIKKNRQTKKLDSDVKKSYENFIKLHSKSKYHNIVKSQYNIIKDNAFIIDEKTGKKLDVNYKKSIEENKKKIINKIKSAYKYVHNTDLYQTEIIQNVNDLSVPGVGTYKSVTNFSFEWIGGRPYILRFVTCSHTHAAREYYEEFLFGEEGELLFTLSVNELKVSTRYYFDGKSLIRVIKDKKVYDLMMISEEMKRDAEEIQKESKKLLFVFNII